MTQDIASLGIKVETGEVAKASTELDGLAQAGAKAEKATESLSGESKKASISIKAMAAETKAAEAATAKLGKQTAATGVSAAQTAAALRGVPAQVTDIITSLQGGQAPLTVLLQQGGQLKDMFGGVGPAAKALGGYVAGLINPFTLAAAAAAALGLAYYKGSEEATAYNTALILTGNAAGTSADQLATLATQVSSTVGTTGAAAEVLAQLAGSSKIAGESFGVVATAALEMQSATGKAIEETVAEFASIGKDPVAAAKTLNDQYNFLTASVYSQIVALKEQGDTIGAAKLLTDTYADTIKTRTADITANLSIWERAWKGVASETRKTLDAFNDIGRAEDASKKIADLSQQVAYAKSAVAADPSDTDAKKKLENSQLELKFLTQQRDTQAALAAAQGLYVERQKASVNAQDKLNAGLTATASNQEKLRDRLKEIDALAKDSASGDGGRVYTPAELNQLREAAKKQFTDKPGGSKALNLTGYNDAQNAIKDLQATYSNSEKELEAQQKAGLITQDTYATQRAVLIKAEKEEVTSAYQAEIKALEAVKAQKGTTAEQSIQLDQKISDAKSAMVRAQKDSDSQLEVLRLKEKERLDKQKLAIQTYTDALNQQNITLRQQGQREAESLGMGDRQKGLQSQFNGIDDKANAQRIDLANQYGDGSRGMSLDEYNAKLKAVAQSQQDLRNTVIANYDDMTSAQGSWTAGASSAWENYLESTRDVAGQTKSLLTNAFSSAEDALVQFVTTGKLSFSDFAKSVLSDMARIAVRQASSSALSSLFGIATSAAGGASAGGSASYTGAYGFDGGGYTGDGGKYQPAGIVHKGEVVIRKEVVQQRGMRGYLERLNKRGYADGGYVGSSDGSASQGGGGETPIVVNVDARESGASGVDPVRLAEAIKVTVRQEIATARRNGGQLT
ncbi:phage tail tape measure protein [Pseudomonas fluorescens group sp. PF-1]